MRHVLALIILGLTSIAQAQDQPSLLLFVGHGYTEDVSVGVYPFHSVWVNRVGAAKSAAQTKLAPYFKSIGECKGSNMSDVIANIKPQLYYNPMTSIFLAQIKVEFILGDGQLMGTLKGAGEKFGYIDSYYVNQNVREAFDAAMQDIATQYAADTRLQKNIYAGLVPNLKREPCALASLISG